MAGQAQANRVEELLDELRRITNELIEVPVKTTHDASHETQLKLLVAPLRRLIQSAITASTELFETYFELGHERSQVPRNVPRALDALVASGTAGHVADIAFMSCWELREKLDSLDQPCKDGFEQNSKCASARRRSIKVLCAVEISVCQLEGLDSELAALYRSELHNALELRRAFSSFRARVAATRLYGSNATGQVRGLGIALARLIGSEGYLHTRADDRRLITALQSRVLDWLRQADEDTDRANHILDEADELITSLRAINKRVELREHDRELVRSVQRRYFRNARPETMPSEALEMLMSLRGRDDRIDALLAQGPQPAEPWQEILARLAGDGHDDPDEPRWSSSRKIYLRGRAEPRASAKHLTK
jgi:hypothetical protein